MMQAYFAENDIYINTGPAVQNAATVGCFARAPDPTSLKEALADEGGDLWLMAAA